MRGNLRRPSKGASKGLSSALLSCALQEQFRKDIRRDRPLSKVKSLVQRRPRLRTQTRTRRKPAPAQPLSEPQKVESSGIRWGVDIFEHPATVRRQEWLQQNMTLAQQMGLVHAPPKPPSRETWESILRKSRARNDSQYPCCVCHEPYTIDAGRKTRGSTVGDPAGQVLLSCSHTLHGVCLRSLEKFTGGNVHRCPVCRQEDYFKCLINDGYVVHTESSAVTIQRFVRGMLARRLFRRMLRTMPARCVQGRRLIVLKRLGKTSDQMQAVMSQKSDALDMFLADISHSAGKSQDVIDQHYINMIARPPSTASWLRIFTAALKRAEPECPICMAQMQYGVLRALTEHMMSGTSSQWAVKVPPAYKTIAVLDCTHCYHATCLHMFEQVAERVSCPTCRKLGYHKHEVSVSLKAVRDRREPVERKQSSSNVTPVPNPTPQQTAVEEEDRSANASGVVQVPGNRVSLDEVSQMIQNRYSNVAVDETGDPRTELDDVTRMIAERRLRESMREQEISEETSVVHDENQRQTLSDVEAWLQGRHAARRRSKMEKRYYHMRFEPEKGSRGSATAAPSASRWK